MINIVAILESRAEHIEAMRAALTEMEEASRAEEGCHDYTFCQEVSNPNVMRINELWESMDAIQAHFATPHMARFSAALGAHPPKSMNMRIHELGAERSLPGR